ncbi:hypothetical protein GTV32_13825 [Gordonia sp. SID5947]|nr:hypothetical protein [Gordonia sp. SID5947]MYR07322.1 hypothetical protein [Gordonia sp. SID5947]
MSRLTIGDTWQQAVTAAVPAGLVVVQLGFHHLRLIDAGIGCGRGVFEQ